MPIERSEKNCENLLFCKGELEEKRVQQYQGKYYVLENLPALVCKQCGERFFRPEVHDYVIELITSQKPPTRTETVAVYDAALKS